MERKCLILPKVFVLQFIVSHLRKHHSNLLKPFIKFCCLLADDTEMTLKDYNILKSEVLTSVNETNQINVRRYGEAGYYLFYLVSFIKLKVFNQYLPEV